MATTQQVLEIASDFFYEAMHHFHHHKWCCYQCWQWTVWKMFGVFLVGLIVLVSNCESHTQFINACTLSGVISYNLLKSIAKILILVLKHNYGVAQISIFINNITTNNSVFNSFMVLAMFELFNYFNISTGQKW